MEWRKSSFSGTEGNCVEVAWRKSSFSTETADCVEVAWLVQAVGVRDSKNTAGGQIDVPEHAWQEFVRTSCK